MAFKELLSPAPSREVDLLVSCVCAPGYVTAEKTTRIENFLEQGDLDWIQFVRLAMRHGVLSLACCNLRQCCTNAIPHGVLKPMEARSQADRAHREFLIQELRALVQAFNAENITALPYKGPTLSQRLYGDSTVRDFGDLDVVIDERNALRAHEHLLNIGYVAVRPLDEAALREHFRMGHEMQFCRKDGAVRVDLHWRFTSRSACLAHDPQRFFERVETVAVQSAIGQNDVLSLRPEAYMLLLSMHAAKHSWAQLKLICDIAELAGTPDVDWQYSLREAADLGLKRVLAISLLVAQSVMGAVIPAGVERELRIDRSTRNLAARACHALFEEPGQNWGAEINYESHLKLRERWRDQTKIRLRHWLPRAIP